MIIYIDRDGVTDMFVEGVCRFHKKENPYKVGLQQSWDVWRLLEMPESDFYAGLEHDFWANLEIDPQARELVALCQSAAGEGNVKFLTTPSRNVGSYSGKAAWVLKHFPKMIRKLTLCCEKHELAAPGRLLIDDSDKNVEAFREHGGMVFLWPRPWNKNYQHVGRGLVMLKEALSDSVGFEVRRCC